MEESLGYHPWSLKHMPVPGRVQIARRKWWMRSAGISGEFGSRDSVAERSYNLIIYHISISSLKVK